jgi:hypothetical protein
MRPFNIFSLIVMIVASLFTLNAIAATDSQVHLLNNLKAKDLELVVKIMEERGYKVVDREIFSKSDKTISITKTEADETDPASIEIQVFAKEDHVKLPKEVFNHKTLSEDLVQALEALPRPSELPKLGQTR